MHGYFVEQVLVIDSHSLAVIIFTVDITVILLWLDCKNNQLLSRDKTPVFCLDFFSRFINPFTTHVICIQVHSCWLLVVIKV